MEPPRPRRSRPRRPANSRCWQVAKLALQTTSLASCAIVVGLSAATTFGAGSGQGYLTIPIAVGTALWTVAELVALCVRRKTSPGRGIHPGAHVGVQLVIFLAMILALFYSCTLWRSVQRSIVPCNEWLPEPGNAGWVTPNGTAYEGGGYDGDDDDGDDDDGGDDEDGWYNGRYNGRSFYCPDSYRAVVNDPAYRGAVQAIIAFCALLWVIHFSLFVRACVETQRRNNDEPPPVIIYPQSAWPPQYMYDDGRSAEAQHQHQHQHDGPQQGVPIHMKHAHYG